jgi:Restriction Enzyme Adenine Methylase Associated
MAKRKRSALVSQYLEGISRTALAEYQPFFREQARRRNGVYALYQRKKLYYVGLARDLRGRLKTHLRDKHGESWDRFSMYLTVGDDHIKELESLVLRIVRPTGNRQGGKFAKAQNLRREFTRRVKQDAAAHLSDLLGVESRRQPVVVRSRPASKAVLASYVSRPMRLRARYKGKVLKARVLSNGVISFAGKRFQSPSMAACAALPHRRAINGWHFWTYERAPGDWVRLRELRR